MSVVVRPLSDFCRVQSGFAFKSKDWQGEGVPVVQIGNVKPRYLDLSSSKFVSCDVAAAAEKFRLKDGDILISMTGHIGSVARKIGDDHVMLNQRVGRFEDIDMSELDPGYLFEVLQSPPIRQRFVKLGYGAAQPNISPKLIGSVEIPVPPLETQQRIAAILGAYDDLIEVNRRRVAMLEEMARGLFKEWFVRFRFPGYDDVPIIDTPDGPLPEGWAFASLGDILYLHYGKALKTSNRVLGDVAVIGSSGIVGSHAEAYVDHPGIVVGRKGNVGAVVWSPKPFWPIDTTYYVETKLPLPYVRELLERVPFQNTDAAVPGLNRDYAHSRKVISPPLHLIDRYGAFAEDVTKQVDLIDQTNAQLAASRDLLLPRLISGQLSVEVAERQLEDAA